MNPAVLHLLSSATLGVYVGAMLTEGCLLVPYWRALPPREFLAWYAANDRRLVRFFGPLTVITPLLAIAAAACAVFRDGPERGPALLAAVLAVVLVAMFPLVFQRANASFAAGTIPAADVPAALARWAAWHWVRTAISIAALAAALVASWRAFA
jgi:hypothetical protein